MPEQQMTYEDILELIQKGREAFQEQIKESEQERKEYSREWRERSAELDRKMQETDRYIKETNRVAREAHKKISKLGSRIGDIIENMVGGNKIIEKFRALGYEIVQCGRNISFEYIKLNIRGEIDLFLENGEIAILIEVKTTLTMADVRRHIDRLEKYRRCADARGDKRRFIGAVAGAVVKNDAMRFAHASGMYVIEQSGEAVEIVPVPEGFQAKEW
jgi:methanogenic corrinoid protein MtbC1